MRINLLAPMFTAVLAALTGCVQPSPQVDKTAQAIRSEQGRGVAEIVSRRYRLDPDVALTSYAAANTDGCSGIMIGPNLFMTAAHCGFNPRTVMFRTYRDTRPTTSDTEAFPCDHLIQSFDDRHLRHQVSFVDGADLMLLFCPPNAHGESPGDKYGYADFDARPVALFEHLYSIWRNPVDCFHNPACRMPPRRPDLDDALLYSEGRVTSINNNDWYVPDGNPHTGITSTLRGEGGSSGSAGMSTGDHRIVLGPNSIGTSTSRGGLSILGYLQDARVGPNVGPVGTLNVRALRDLGLDPDDFLGGLDKDGNNLFDVQEAIERLRGENQRDHLWLGFESPRRNALWRGHSHRFHPEIRTLHIHVPSGQFVMRHDLLNLKPHTVYRASVMSHTQSSEYPQGLKFRILDKRRNTDGSTTSRFTSDVNIETTPATGWQMHTFSLRTAGNPAELQLVANGHLDVSLAALSLIESDSVMDFDSHDKRYNWRNDNDGSRAIIIPDGRTLGTPNWAGLVQHRVTAPSNWPLRNRQLAIVRHQHYRYCFDVKLYDSPAASVNAEWGVFQLASGSTIVVEQRFTPTTSWREVCTNRVEARYHDNVVRFGTQHSPGIPATLSYLVDNLRIDGPEPPPDSRSPEPELRSIEDIRRLNEDLRRIEEMLRTPRPDLLLDIRAPDIELPPQ